MMSNSPSQWVAPGITRIVAPVGAIGLENRARDNPDGSTPLLSALLGNQMKDEIVAKISKRYTKRRCGCWYCKRTRKQMSRVGVVVTQ